MSSHATDTTPAPSVHDLLLGAGRAFGGAVLFALPLLMTMEMWALAVVLSPLRLALFLAVDLVVLVGLARYLGFRDPHGLRLTDHVADALVAFGIGAVTSMAILSLLGIVDGRQSVAEVVALVAIQTVPASIGAAIARSQFVTGGQPRQTDSRYRDEIMLMAVGAGVFCFNIAPTEEVVRIATRIGDLRAAAVAVASIAGMHAMVYLLGFRGEHRSDASGWSVLFGYSVVGYAVTLAVCAYLIWIFGHADTAPWSFVVVQTVVLAVPGALGAAAARLIL